MISASPAFQSVQIVRKSVQIAVFAALGLAGLHSTASAEEWLLTPYLRADFGYSSTVQYTAGLINHLGTPNIFDTDPHTGARYQVGAGLKLNTYLRTDLTISYRDNMADLDAYYSGSGTRYEQTAGRQNTSNITTMLAGYVDPFAAFDMNTGAFSPYVQAGIGWARNNTKSAKILPNGGTLHGTTYDNFAWQVGAGLNYALTDQWKIDLSYRYIDMGEARGSKSFTSSSGNPDRLVREMRYDLVAHEVLLGLQYQF